MKMKNIGNKIRILPLLPILVIGWYTASQTYAANKAPALMILQPRDGSKISGQATTITGSTTPGSQIKINQVPVSVSEDGNFSVTTSLTAGKVAKFTIQALDRQGKSSSKTIQVVSDYPRTEEIVIIKTP